MEKAENAKGGSVSVTTAIATSDVQKQISSDVPKQVEEEENYHGLLPREDLPDLLKKTGDFLIRVTQPKPGDPRELVISLRVSDEDSPSAIRHIVIRKRMGKDGNTEWVAIEQNKFNSVKELIDTYVADRKPINPEIKTSILIHGVPRQSWEFLHENITVNDLLGEGQFGEVRAGEALINGKKIPVAIKLLKEIKDAKQLEQVKEKIKEMMHEARLMRYFNHENVIRIHGVAVCREPIMIIMEKVDGGCLSDVLEIRKGKIDEVEKIENMSLGSARGLEYIHAQNVIHRDIAARNVLYTEKMVAKITDFGMSRQGDFYEMGRGNKKVPLRWTAPESMVAYQYTPKTDVFSYSILLWEIFSDGDEPYKGMTSIEVKRMISCGERLQKPEGCPDFMFHIMQKCWEQNPNNRYTMSEVVRRLEEIVDRVYSEDHESTQAQESQKLSTKGSREIVSLKERGDSIEEPGSLTSSRRKKRRSKYRKKKGRRRRSKHRKSEGNEPRPDVRHRKSRTETSEKDATSFAMNERNIITIPRRRRRKPSHKAL